MAQFEFLAREIDISYNKHNYTIGVGLTCQESDYSLAHALFAYRCVPHRHRPSLFRRERLEMEEEHTVVLRFVYGYLLYPRSITVLFL